jgi:hypothetical protein
MKKVVSLTLLSITVFLLLSCSSTLQKDLNTALVFEGQAQSAEQTIVLVAQQAIALLPAASQAKAQSDLQQAAQAATLAFAAKDSALQAAIDADSANGLNLPQLIADITTAIQAIVALANSFGADQTVTTKLMSIATRVPVPKSGL